MDTVLCNALLRLPADLHFWDLGRKNTRVSECCGERGVDDWKPELWCFLSDAHPCEFPKFTAALNFYQPHMEGKNTHTCFTLDLKDGTGKHW